MLSSIAKLSSMESFELYIFSFGFATFDICSLVARAVVIMEFLLGSFLVFNLLHRFTKWITAAFLAIFSIFLLWRMIAGDTESCHCMGDIVDLNPLESLIKNICLALFLVLAWKAEDRPINHRNLWLCISSSVVMLSCSKTGFEEIRVGEDFVVILFTVTLYLFIKAFIAFVATVRLGGRISKEPCTTS